MFKLIENTEPKLRNSFTLAVDWTPGQIVSVRGYASEPNIGNLKYDGTDDIEFQEDISPVTKKTIEEGLATGRYAPGIPFNDKNGILARVIKPTLELPWGLAHGRLVLYQEPLEDASHGRIIRAEEKPEYKPAIFVIRAFMNRHEHTLRKPITIDTYEFSRPGIKPISDSTLIHPIRTTTNGPRVVPSGF